MKRNLMLLFSCWSISCFAGAMRPNCGQASPIDDPQFCASFKRVATCHCVYSGLPEKNCQDMNFIYNLMLNRFGSLEKACKWEEDTYHDTTVKICTESWIAYLKKC